MKEHTKAQRAEKKALEMLAKLGVDTSKVQASPTTYSRTESISEKSLQAEATLAYWESGREFREKTCSHCGKKFATNYNTVGNCSDKCRIEELALIGIEWSPTKTQHERWGRTPPLVVPQEALELIEQIRSENLEEVPVQDESSLDVDDELPHQSTNDSHTVPEFSLD